MGYQVMTYEVAEQLMLKDSLFAKYKDAIHITATNSLKRGMMESNTELSHWIDGPILSFSELSKFVGNKWFSGQTELQQFTLLSKALRQYNEDNQNFSNELFSSIDKNQETILKTIRLLVESGLTSHDIRKAARNGLTEEERIFLDLWRYLEEENAFQPFHDWFMEFKEDTVNYFKKCLAAALRHMKKSDSRRVKANLLTDANIDTLIANQFESRRVIVLHGFYFILPIQKRIFDQLSKHVKVIHVVNYKEGYPNGFQAVRAFLDLSSSGYEEASKTKFPVNSVAKKFLEVINGIFPDGTGDALPAKGKPNYYEFINLYQFKNYIESKDEVIISPRSKEVKSYFEDVYSSKNHKLTQYPMGQFLLDVHRLNTRKYNVSLRRFEDAENLSMPLILRLFSTGYLMIDGLPANKYMKSLQKLTPLLEDATTFEKWQKAINKLMVRKKKIEDKLKHDLAKKDLDHKLNTYYNRNLAFFNVPFKDLLAIKQGLTNLSELYESLYSGDAVPIREYVELLEGFISEDVVPSLQQAVDQKVADKILESLSDLKNVAVESFDRQDLMRGLNFFLSRETDADEYQAELSGNQDTDHSDMIASLLNSDGVQFAGNRSVHFAFMDNKAFPNAQQLMTWPLSQETLQVLYSENINLRQLKMRKDLEVDIACYLLYIIMNNAINVKFSIVKELNQEKKLQPTFYLKLLNLRKAYEKDLLNITSDHQPSGETMTKNMGFHDRAYEFLVRKTYNRCPKRAAYSFLINERPEFSRDFHEIFVFQNLLRRAMDLSKSKYDCKEQYKEIYSWFPHWSKTKKDMYRRNIEEYMQGQRYFKTFTRLDGHYYPDAQINLALFGERSPREARGLADYEYDRPGKPFAKPGPNCKYCPFQEQCIEAELYEK
ncbi:hypothetical protein QNK12_15090 [Neobacillus cucumis]|nr:hypothetical protein QNK12_15090 [Neobacillus cucumis]